MPLTARLSASVPPPVKTTSYGLAPIAAATRSRDSSTTRRARRPEACSEDGLPVSSCAAATASAASGSIGVVAAWSRYAIARKPTACRAAGAARPPACAGQRRPAAARDRRRRRAAISGAGGAGGAGPARARARCARAGRAAGPAGQHGAGQRDDEHEQVSTPAARSIGSSPRALAATSAPASPMHSALATESDSCRAEEFAPRSAGGLNESSSTDRLDIASPMPQPPATQTG